jgi:hypothetical protein
MPIVEGPDVSGNVPGDEKGRSVKAGDTVRIDGTNTDLDGLEGVVQDLVVVLVENGSMVSLPRDVLRRHDGDR